MGAKIQFGLKSAGAAIAGVWLSLHPLVHALIFLMCIDYATGLLAAAVTNSIESGRAFRGAAKKAIMLLVVACAAIAARIWELGDPLGAVVAGFYCVHEVISITENAARAGVPVPKFLSERLSQAAAAGESKKPA